MGKAKGYKEYKVVVDFGTVIYETHFSSLEEAEQDYREVEGRLLELAGEGDLIGDAIDSRLGRYLDSWALKEGLLFHILRSRALLRERGDVAVVLLGVETTSNGEGGIVRG